MIKEMIVVEGKEDTRRLKEILGDVHTIETRGSAIDEKTIELIRQAQQTVGVIVFTDPDYPGQRIRHIINQAVPGCKNAFVAKDDAVDEQKGKVGIEHCSREVILEALQHVVTYHEQKPIETITQKQLMDLQLIGFLDSKERRNYISDQLHLGYNNAKQFKRKVTLFQIPLETLQQLTEKYNQMGNDKDD